MPRKRIYESDAARKAAQRERDKVAFVQVPRSVHDAQSARLESLHCAVKDAAKRNGTPQSEAAKECQAASVETMIEKLTAWFDCSRA
jgi:hypothetical protein